MLSFIPVVMSKPPFPSFLISSFFASILCSVAAIRCSRPRALPRQYSSSWPDMGTTPVFVFPFALLVAAAPGAAGLSLPTTDMPLPCRPAKSSSVCTFFGLAFSFSVFFAASAADSSFCGGCDCVWDEDCCEDRESLGRIRGPLAEIDRGGPQQSWKNPKDILKQAGSDHCSWKTFHWEGTNRKQRSLPAQSSRTDFVERN